MPSLLRFGGGLGPTENSEGNVVSEPFSLFPEEVAEILDVHDDAQGTKRAKFESERMFYLSSGGESNVRCNFHPPGEGAQKWKVFITKLADEKPDLPPHLAEILSEKAPAREVQGVGPIEEEWPFPISQ